MAYYNFTHLIKKYSSTFTLLTTSEGGYNEMGDYVVGSITEQELTGAIMDVSESKIYKSNGTLTAKDKTLYMFDEIKNLVGAYIVYKNDKYHVESEKTDGDFTDVFQYSLKYVSAFK